MILRRPKHEIEDRSKAIRLDFAKRYDLDELREQLFREQDGVCAICKKPLQDSCSVITAVDHAISIYLYATWDYPIEEASMYANARCNLLAVHHLCNIAKSGVDFEEFVERLASGELSLVPVVALTLEKIQRLKEQNSERGRKGGRVGGRTRGKETFENKTGIFAPEHYGKGGRIGGRVAAAIPGHMANIGHKGGLVAGRIAVEGGHLVRVASLGGRVASVINNHNRWHVARGISKPDVCNLCRVGGISSGV